MQQYKSCRWIEHGMVLDYCNIIRVCNNFNPVKGGRPVLYTGYQGQKIDWEEFFSIKNAHREKFRNGECISECENCIGFEDREWDGENYIDNLLLTPWYACNSNCIYCAASTDRYVAENTKPYDVAALIKDMIENNILKKDGVMDFAGGEPTIYKDFEELLNLFLDNDFKRIVVHTNAIKYISAIQKGIESGRVNILVSVDSGTKPMHQRIKQVDSYDVVWENLTKYAQVQPAPYNSVKSKYIVIPGVNDSKEEIDMWLQKCSNIGIKNVVLNLDFNWLLENIDETLLGIYDIMQYTISQAEKLGLFCELYGQMFQVKTIIENKVEYNKAGF